MQKFRIKGKLFIHAVHAKYLLRDGGMPDPFLKFTFPNKKEDTTRTAKKTNFPSWMQIITTDIEMSRNDAGFVDVEIIDSNFAFNSKLGKFAVDVDPCYGAPNTWAVNKVFQVEPPKDKESKIL